MNLKNIMNLKNKIVLITGASGGIGMAIAKAFGEQGAELILHYANTKINIDTLQNELAAIGVKSFAVRADFRKREDIKRMFGKVSDRFSRIDILVNNAGIYRSHKEVFDTSLWEDEMRVNFFAAVECSGFSLKLMKNKGVVINISSVYGVDKFTEDFRELPYAISKTALNKFTEMMAAQYAPKIRVVSVNPGYVITPIWKSVSNKDKKQAVSQVPIKRFINPEEVASLVVELARNEAITGSQFIIDGGLIIGK